MDFCNLKKQHLSIKKEINSSIKKVVESGSFILGKEVREFEKEAARYFKSKYAIAVASGTDALVLSAMALGIKSGDEIICTPLTMIASLQCTLQLGAKPVFVDVDPKTYNIDTSKIEEKITKKTKAIVAVHFYGNPVNMARLMKIARKHKLRVIEDVAQASGAYYRNKAVGTIGDMGCLSFFPTKNLGAYGDGGMILTNDRKTADMIYTLRVHGAREKYNHIIPGLNSRLDSLQAAILRTKLPYLKKWNQMRRKNAYQYNKAFKKNKDVVTPIEEREGYHVYHQYTLRVPRKRDELVAYLKKFDVPTMIYYPTPLHLQPVFEKFGYRKGEFPEAEKATNEILSLPIYPELSLKEQNQIIEVLKNFFE